MLSPVRLISIASFALLVYSQGNPVNIEPDLLYPRETDSIYSYPSPNITGIGGWDVAIKKAKNFVSQLTLEEKVSICTGNGFPGEP